MIRKTGIEAETHILFVEKRRKPGIAFVFEIDERANYIAYHYALAHSHVEDTTHVWALTCIDGDQEESMKIMHTLRAENQKIDSGMPLSIINALHWPTLRNPKTMQKMDTTPLTARGMLEEELLMRILMQNRKIPSHTENQ